MIPIITMGFDTDRFSGAAPFTLQGLAPLQANLKKLEASLQDVTVDLLSEEIVTDSKGNDYVLFKLLDAGTRAHLILPVKPNGVLVFEIGGKTIFSRWARHPGITPRNWTAQVLPIMRNVFRSRSAEIVSQIVNGSFNPRHFFFEVMEEVEKALKERVPGKRLKNSFRIDAG